MGFMNTTSKRACMTWKGFSIFDFRYGTVIAETPQDAFSYYVKMRGIDQNEVGTQDQYDLNQRIWINPDLEEEGPDFTGRQYINWLFKKGYLHDGLFFIEHP